MKKPADIDEYIAAFADINNYAQKHNDECRSKVELQMSTYKNLVATARRADPARLWMNCSKPASRQARHTMCPAKHLPTYSTAPRGTKPSRHWRKAADGNAVVQFQKTDRKGRARFRLSSGEQMVSVVHMTAHPKPAEADWQSIWGNLTFCLK